MPKVSIIIPVYNGEKYLKQCLDSLLNQTLSDIEIICINDNSKDGSLDILKSYADIDKRLRIINSEINQGQSVSRNIGIENAKSDYIMFIDQDDWYDITACQKAFEQISQNHNDFVIFNLWHHWEEENRHYIDEKRLKPFAEVINNPEIKPYEVNTNIFVSAYIWCEIFSKEFLTKNNIRFFTEKQADDVPFFIHAMVSAESVSVINEPLYHYRRYKESTTSIRTDLWESLFTARNKAYNFVMQSPHKESFINPFIVYYITTMLHWYKSFTDADKTIKKDFYNKLRSKFLFINKIYSKNIKLIRKQINYSLYRRIINENWTLYCITEFMHKMLSFRESGDKTCYCLMLLGRKIIFRKKY